MAAANAKLVAAFNRPSTGGPTDPTDHTDQTEMVTRHRSVTFNRPSNIVEPSDPTDITDQIKMVTRLRSVMSFNRPANVVDQADQTELVGRRRSVTFNRTSSLVDQTDQTDLVNRRRSVTFGANPRFGNCPHLSGTADSTSSDRSETVTSAISDPLHLISGLVVNIPKSPFDSPTADEDDGDPAYVHDLSVAPPKPTLASRFVSKLRLLTGSMTVNDRSCSGDLEPESPPSPQTHTPSPPPTPSRSTQAEQLRGYTSFTSGSSPMARRRVHSNASSSSCILVQSSILAPIVCGTSSSTTERPSNPGRGRCKVSLPSSVTSPRRRHFASPSLLKVCSVTATTPPPTAQPSSMPPHGCPGGSGVSLQSLPEVIFNFHLWPFLSSEDIKNVRILSKDMRNRADACVTSQEIRIPAGPSHLPSLQNQLTKFSQIEALTLYYGGSMKKDATGNDMVRLFRAYSPSSVNIRKLRIVGKLTAPTWHH
eukprot:gene8481-4842_t